MKIQVSLDGRKRKELAIAVGTILGAPVSYKGPPTYEFEVGKASIGRDGSISLKNARAVTENRLLEGLQERGFMPILTEDAKNLLSRDSSNDAEVSWDDGLPFTEVARKEDAELPDSTTIQMPLDGFDETALQNLRLLVDSKALLIQKAMEIADMPIVKTEISIDFPWFERILSAEEFTAYSHFIAALCDMAKRQKRVVATEKPTENEKFTFRLFLVRLGLIGDEYADTRRILLRNLSGNGSWKDSEPRKTAAQTTEKKNTAKDILDFFALIADTDDAEKAIQKLLFCKQLWDFLQQFEL